MFLLTLLAWVVALLVAKGLRMTILKGEATPFVLELPPYRVPTFSGLMIHTWEKTWQYIKKAGTVILGISIILWAMMTFPSLPADQLASFDAQRQEILAGASPTVVAQRESGEKNKEVENLSRLLLIVAHAESEATLRYSVAGTIGTSLESVSQYAGFDWRTNIALVGGFAAKEVIISTLGTAYSLGEVDPDATGSLAETLKKDPSWNKVKAFAVIVFMMFYAPCFVTVACIIKEAGHWKWGWFSMAFNTGFAFTLATIVYQVGMRIP
jgi:ferrous iron transport protein B